MPFVEEASRQSAVAPRAVLSLDGLWDFAYSGPAAQLVGTRQIRVPGIWQAQFPELRNSTGAGRYSRMVELPEAWAGGPVFLVMEGVFHHAEIFVDGQRVGAHRNAWTPVELDLSAALGGTRTFALEVVATVPDDRDYSQGGSFTTALAGKQDWYGFQGGIWKSVRLEARDAAHLSGVSVQAYTDLAAHRVSVKADATGAAGSIVLTLARDGAVVAEQRFPVGAGAIDVAMAVPEVALWSPGTPVLYELSVTLCDAQGAALDTVSRVVGFRCFENRDGRLFLNGAPFYMFGALDQDWYPEAECRSPDPAFLEQRFRNARAMGLNTLRCHVKIPDKLYLELADRLGLVVWLDMPYMEFLAPETREQLAETFRESARHHAHHPSICIWTIINEGWGIDLDDNPDDRAWLKQQVDIARALVPGSMVVDNSPCFPRNYHLKTDIEDFHWYTGFPLQNAQFDRHARDFAGRADWAWSPHGDAERTGSEPLICSEFGVWGLPHRKDILEKDGSEPWWFESGHDWNNGAAYPHGMDVRFRDAQLAPVFGDVDGFVDAAQELQWRALKYQVETLRWYDAIGGYIITELNDCQWEANGLMDARNTPRAFAGRLAQLQRPWLVIGRPPRTTLRPGESLDIPVRLAGPADVPEGATLRWRFGGSSGSAPVAAAGGRAVVQQITVAAPAADAIATLDLLLEVHDGVGALLSANHIEFCVVPPLGAGIPALLPADDGAAAVLAAVGWPALAASAGAADLVLATRLTTPVREHLLAGRKVLLVANSTEALVDPERQLPYPDLVNFPKMEVRERERTYWDGRWMGAFSWRRLDGPWAGLPNGPMLDEHWQGLVPNHVLTGFRSAAFGGLVDAGMAVAWLHKAAAFSKRSFLGKGWMTVTTFDLTSTAAGHNPLAAHLLLALARS